MITLVFGFLVVLLSVVFAVAGLVLVLCLVPLAVRESHNDAMGIIVRCFM